ncbi:MAG: SAM-dependent methyltransferase [Actinoplanes sp.]
MTEPQLDLTRPSSARVWNYLLGGTDNFEIDRTVGDQIRDALPEIVLVAQGQRKLLARAVTWLAADVGVRQFLDIGTGLPVADNTHEVAQRAAPDARVVYVDNDPLVLVHARTLLAGHTGGEIDYIHSAVEDPENILREAARTLDLSQPVALVMLGILGNVADHDQARDIVRRLLAGVPSGSYLIIADGTSTSPGIIEGQRRANQSGHPYHLRSPEQIASYFDGLELLDPGVVTTPHWRPETSTLPPAIDGYCGVARKP